MLIILELLAAFQDKSSLKLTLSGEVSIWIGDLKLCSLLPGTYDRKFYFNAQKCELSKVQILLARLLYAKQILTQNLINIDIQFLRRAEGSF